MKEQNEVSRTQARGFSNEIIKRPNLLRSLKRFVLKGKVFGPGKHKSVTLLELLMSIILLSIIILGLTSIDFFSRNIVVNADIKSRLQNKIYLAMEHIKKNAALAIGNESINYPAEAEKVIDVTEVTGPDEKSRIKIFADINGDGIRQEPGGPPPAVNEDHWIVYRCYYEQGAVANRFKLQYCSYCRSKTCNGANCASGWVVVSSNIRQFIPIKPMDGNSVLTDNYLDVEITACLHPENDFDADATNNCGSAKNPQSTMRSRILLPSVAVN